MFHNGKSKSPVGGVNLFKSSPNFTISQFYGVLKNPPNANLSIGACVCDGSRNVPDIMLY